MAKREDYAELAAQAERAVSGVKDAELRRVAFEKILEDLLGSGSSKRSTGKSSGLKKVSQGGKKSGRRGPTGYLREMVDEGFFKKPKTMAAVKAELENRGHHIPFTSLSGPLQTLCQKKELRRQKTKTTGKKQAYTYSEW